MTHCTNERNACYTSPYTKFTILRNTTAKIYYFFLLKNPQQVLKFYPQILRKEASFYIYHSQLTQLTDIAYVITSVYDAQNLRRKLVFAVLQR